MNKARREQINHLVDIYLNDLVSAKHDAGWHGDSMLARLIEFKGEIPPPTGYDQSNTHMIHEIRFLTEDHALLPDIKAALYTIPPHYSLAICARRFYVGMYLPEGGDPRTAREFNDEIRARLVGLNPKSFDKHVEQAYKKLNETLQILELRREFEEKAA